MIRNRIDAPRTLRHVVGYVVAVVATSGSTLAIQNVNRLARVPTISLLYLLVILAIAVYFGTSVSLFTTALALLQYDFFLLQPLYTLSISRVADGLAFVIFAVVAVITGQLAGLARERTDAAHRRAKESMVLYELAQALMSARDVSHVLDEMTSRIVDVFGVDRCSIFSPGPDGRLELAAEAPTGGNHDRAIRATASWVLREGTEVALGVGAGEGDRQRIYVPLRTADRVVGVMEVGRKRGQPLDGDDRKLVASFAAQAALAIARAESEDARYRLQVAEESDRLKTALLNAVSHDLRTPLASIKASATALLLADTRLSVSESREFLQAIDRESDRLNRLVGNLLDLSRIEAGVLRPVLDWYVVTDVMEAVLERVQQVIGERLVVLEVEPDLPPLRLDLLRVEEMLINLIENAHKYAPADSPVTLRVRSRSSTVALAVVDHGPGVPVEIRTRVFETFYRGRVHGDRHPGTGLGLAICRGIAETHGGSIGVSETPGGGATFEFTLPASCVGAGVTV